MIKVYLAKYRLPQRGIITYIINYLHAVLYQVTKVTSAEHY